MSEPALVQATHQPATVGAQRGESRFNVVATLLVVAFAFLAASFMARNSDLWLHLATGRLLAAGDFAFGVDPFSYTTVGKYWTNHSWLFDVALFQAFALFGGSGLVAIKAAGVALTAGLMLCLARGRGSSWVSAGCVLVAVLAMSPRLLLQPTIASMALLAACLLCLRTGGRVLMAVPALIALWVNVDAWFILGPALVLFFAAGRWLEPDRTTVSRWPGWLVPASLLACLASPHHIHAIQLPMELSPAVWTSEFREDPRFAGLFLSPWRWSSVGPAGGYSPAAWAYFALLGIGAGSFAMNRRAVRSWRLTVWIPFALLSAWQARLIPFFAVVAGPIAALNLCEIVPVHRFRRAGRMLVLAAGVILVGLAWMGWTTGIYSQDRGAAWGVYRDPTLVRAAEGIEAWRNEPGLPPDTRVLATHPDVGHYLAWFAPGERYFLDSRLTLFTPVAREFVSISQAVGLLSGGEPSLSGARDRGAILLYDPDAGRMTRALHEAVANRWTISRIDGASVLLLPSQSAAKEGFDADAYAFGDMAPLAVAGAGPSSLAEPAPWWRLTRRFGRAGSWEADAATIYLRLAELRGERSPAIPMVAIRAARLGTEKDAGDPIAWLALGRAYLSLLEVGWEHDSGSRLSPLEHIRMMQTTGALIQAGLLNPDSALVHESLARLFFHRHILDLAYRHARTADRLGQRMAGFSPEYADRAREKAVLADTIEAAVQDAENRYLVHTSALRGDPLAQARTAVQLGLPQKAIDVLIGSHPDLYGPEGIKLLGDLLLQTGQIAEARALLDREELRKNPEALGAYTLPGMPGDDGEGMAYPLPAYDWLDLCQRAAAGQYAEALDAIARMSARFAAEEEHVRPAVHRAAAAHAVHEIGLAASPAASTDIIIGLPQRLGLSNLLAQIDALAIVWADLNTMAGILELERGNRSGAAVRLETAVELYSATRKGSARAGAALAGRYHEVLRSRRSSPK